MRFGEGADRFPKVRLGLTRHRSPHYSRSDTLQPRIENTIRKYRGVMHAKVDQYPGIAIAEDIVLVR